MTIQTGKWAKVLTQTLAVLLWLWLTVDVTAALPQAATSDGPRYGLLQLDVVYEGGNVPLPATSTLMRRPITLGVTETGLVAHRDGLPKVTLPIRRINELTALPDRVFHRSAIDAIGAALSDELAERGYPGATVEPAGGQIGPEDEDQRTHPDVLSLVIRPASPPAAMPRLPITDLDMDYIGNVPGLPPAAFAEEAKITLAVAEGGLRAKQKGFVHYRVKLKSFDRLPDRIFYPDAIETMRAAVAEQYQLLGFRGVAVTVAPGQISASGEDLRPAGTTTLRLLVDASRAVSAVTQITKADGGWYPVSAIQLAYEPSRDSLPAAAALMNAPITLGQTEAGYVAYRKGLVKRNLTLAELDAMPEAMLFGSAIREVSRAVVARMNEDGLVGVVVRPEPGQFDPYGQDLRPEGDNTLKLVVKPGVVREVHTIASGARVDEDERRDSDLHQRIRAHSPVQPADAGNDEDLLNEDVVERYVHFLNRHPSRRVDAAISAAAEPGALSVDYLIYEAKPWIVYAQVSNTGTSQTSDWRERFGFAHHQLTGTDDILRFDYVTAGFQESHAVSGSYEFPLFTLDRLRVRLHAGYSEFAASDIGLFGEDFEGDSWQVGGELIFNVFQRDQFFLDLVGGMRYEEIHVLNEVLLTEADEPFLIPHAGVRVQSVRQTDALNAGVRWEMNLDDAAGTDPTMIDFLGRGNVETEWSMLSFDASYSVYLEPLLAGGNAMNADAPPTKSLVHELAFIARGQMPLDDKRVIAQQQRTIGGFYTVRGYDESVAVGDQALLLTAEYRYHLPRQFEPGAPRSLFGSPVQWRPANAQARPDWDLIFRTFVDYGSVSNNSPVLPTEDNADLLTAGVGIELQFKRNLNLRIDWAAALKDVAGEAEAGDSRVHFVGTLVY